MGKMVAWFSFILLLVFLFKFCHGEEGVSVMSKGVSFISLILVFMPLSASYRPLVLAGILVMVAVLFVQSTTPPPLLAAVVAGLGLVSSTTASMIVFLKPAEGVPIRKVVLIGWLQFLVVEAAILIDSPIWILCVVLIIAFWRWCEWRDRPLRTVP